MTFAEDKAAQQATVATYTAQAEAFLNALVQQTNVAFSNGFNIDSILPANYDYASVPTVNFGITSSRFSPNIAMGGDLPPAVSRPSLSLSIDATVPDFLPSDLLPPALNFSPAEAAYASVLLDPLKTKLLYDLQNGGYGIDTTDETLLLNRARDREVEVALTRIDEAGRAMAIRGFPLPPGELAVAVDRAYQDMQDKVSGVSREIYIDRAKRFVDNRQFTMREARELEQVLIAFHNAVQERALNVSRYTVELGIAIYNASLARFKLQLETSVASVDASAKKLQFQFEQARVNLDGFRAEIVGYEANLRRQIEAARLQIEYYRGTLDEARLINDGAIARTTLQQKVIEATVQQNIQISQMTIENAKAKLAATVEALKFKVEGTRYGSERYFAILSSLMSTLNTLSVSTATA